jgi:hypothetical protein
VRKQANAELDLMGFEIDTGKLGRAKEGVKRKNGRDSLRSWLQAVL